MHFRIRYRLKGSHVWCRLFVNRAYAGRFILRADEFRALQEAFGGAEYIEEQA